MQDLESEDPIRTINFSEVKDICPTNECSNDDDDELLCCPVLEQQDFPQEPLPPQKMRKRSNSIMKYYRSKKKRKKKFDVSLNKPPDLIPEIDAMDSFASPRPPVSSKLNRTSINMKKKLILDREHNRNTGKRGSNGWEECLRPRPSQVEHFQSLMMIQLQKERNQREIAKQAKKHKRLTFEDKLMQNKIASYLSPHSVSSSDSMDEMSDTKAIILPPSCSQGSSGVYNENYEPSKRCKMTIMDCGTHSRPDNVSEEIEQSQVESNEILETEYIVGDVVWAKLGSTRWWPAMVVWGGDCGQIPAHVGQVWVFWFGDHKISELPNDKLLDFIKNFRTKYSDIPGKTFRRGIVEAVRELAVRAEVVHLVADSELIHWAKCGFPVAIAKIQPYSPDPGNPYPESVRAHLARIKGLYLQAMEADAKLETRSSRREQADKCSERSLLKKVHEGIMKIQDVCISCDSPDVNVMCQHPLFEGGLCRECRDEIKDSMFAYGDDGTNAYCVICGNAGILLICDNNECNRCYCTGCIEILISVEAREKAEATEPWLCYLCNDESDSGLIKRKSDWQQNVVAMFQPENNVHIPSMEAYHDKRPIRVFSLFDGIGTCKFVLNQLGFDVEVYYASEIDMDAKNVVAVHHKNQVTHVGDIEHLTDQQVAKLCPLDLLIGGSPCNDLSLVNPARKGLYDPAGTGRLFFDFFRVLKAVQLANQGRHVFWMYENVASMPVEYRLTINRFLQCEPSLVDSKYFSPQNRARYFWGNIPGMYSPLQPHITEQSITLNSVLTPHCNRTAQVEKIRTVTTRSNSLKQGKMAIHPVQMNGENDTLWVTELEQIFGFPKHYTDVGNIALGRRQQLLGKAWSVPVIKHLLTPLKNFFKTSSSQTNTAVQTTVVIPPSTSDNTAIIESYNTATTNNNSQEITQGNEHSL